MFRITPGRYFSAHAITPRTFENWLDEFKYTSWIEEHITKVGREQESKQRLQPRQIFGTDMKIGQVRNFALHLLTLNCPRTLQNTIRVEISRLGHMALVKRIFRKKPELQMSEAHAYLQTLPPNGIMYQG